MCAFLHACLSENEMVYIQMPIYFKQYDSKGRQRVLRLKSNLYGLNQGPREYWQYMVEKFKKFELEPSQLDPWLFVGKNCIVLI